MTDTDGSDWNKAISDTAVAVAEVTRSARSAAIGLRPILEPLVGILGDRLDAFRFKQKLRLIDEAEGILRKRNQSLDLREVAPSFLIPLFDKASLETDDDLQTVWASLLANAIDAAQQSEMRGAFISMLSEMTHFDVQILATLDKNHRHFGDGYLVTDKLPDGIAHLPLDSGYNPGAPSQRVELSLANLGRLGCILPVTTYSGPSYSAVIMTQLGIAFVEACSDPSHETHKDQTSSEL